MTDPISGEALRQRAQLAGIALHYTSFWGEHREVPATVIERALDAMGEHADTTAVPSAVLVTHGTASDVPLEAEGPWRLFTAETAERTLVCEGHGTTAQLPASLEMGYYALQAAGSAKERLVIVAPEHCWSPEPLRQGERWWGLSAQLYALRSERNWGIGDFSDLTDLVSIAAGQGAAFVGLSPLHALRADQPEAASPYSPSSRLALNTLFIDVAAVPEFMRSAAAQALFSDAAFQQRLGALRASDTVRYAEVTTAKQEMLSLLWDEFLRSEWEASSPRAEAFREFMQRNADVLGQHALYEAIQYHLHAIDPGVWGWPAWPEAMQDPHGAAVKAFAQEHAQQVHYRFWLQWLAHEQLDRVSQRARAMMPLGLYCDLAVGANDGGSETWTGQGLYAHGMRVGAPPDPLNHQGQDWGLPPMNPCALAASHFLPMRRLLKSVMRPAGALRMDHVMALMRLFWTSADGGTYVSYPLDALLTIMSIESHRQQCLVIGEDLGNVAPQMREAMAQRTLLSYRPLIFERVDGGAFRAPAHWPHQALAVVSTHDLPTLRGFWAAEDIDVQSRLGWLSAPDAHARALMDRAQDRVRLLIALNEEGLLPEGATADPQSVPEANADFAAAVHRYLARTPCWLAAVQLEDVTGQLEQVNVPGSTEAMQPNWRRRLSVPLEKLATHACFSAIAAAMRAERGGAALPFSEALPALDTADIPLATYRVQFHEGNTFEQVTRAVPYLHALGISHLYSSPYLKAVPGSTHGYNVVDPTRLNPEVGSETTHAALCEALQAHGLSQVLDIVPNHMGVLDANNPWWQDVLEHGRASAHAGTFDIEWEPTAPDMHGRVLLPMLGGHYGRVLESGELQMAFDAKCGRFSVRYWDHELPIDPQHYARIFAAVAPPISGGDRDGDSLAQMQSLVDAFGNLPSRNAVDDNERAMRQRDAPLHQRRLAELAAEHPWVRQWIDALLTQWNGHKETPESFDALDQLLRDQAYRLADWRVAGDDINYRRFFDVNSLAAVRMEDPAVFEAAHACIFRWLAEGKISGLRIDHPDGLADPAQYFDRLQRRYASLARAAGREPRALYLIVEKILADHEPLPQDWPVHGATGYRFSSLVNGLFVEPASQAAFDDAYSAFTGDRKEFEEAVHECKKHIIETSLFSDLGWLADTLYNISRTDRKTCDFTRNQLRIALTEVAAVFPVYRTYIAPDGTGLSDTDRQHIEWTIASARRRMGTAEGGVLAYLQGVFLGTEGQHAPELRGAFLRRWQQFTAPVMAKSVEDTAFYRYVRLVSLNDVGSEPRRFGLSGAAFHQANLQRSRRLPHGLLATSTHDSKRSEDLRARLNVLSEIPALWEDTAIQLRELGTRFSTEVDGVTVPSAHDLWALYQALVGIWPAGGADVQERISLRERAKEYMVKAMREAKQATNWLFPNEAYEAAVHRYIDGALSTERFVRELEKFVQAVAPYGFQNSLCQLALKLTVPGVPDIYQGCEQWNFSLVDPDNRRPVDFEALERSLEQVQSLYAQGYPSVQAWTDMLTAVPDAKVKQLVTWRLLQLRQKMPDLFLSSTYLPLTIEGPSAEHAVAFARIRDGKAMVVICSRLLYGLTEMGWRGTRFAIAPAHPVLGKVARWKNWVTGATMAAEAEDGIEIETLMGEAQPQGGALPFVVLVPEDIE
ncbi:malto-oligosyltrehalose synthase [Paracidovorax valerianellae]|uniref:4-alpha-glucanotransferase n=1 Tax=Paracidovorax valerianellae TaxID=187868 RepID=A0A1G6JK02_9BURK|nr:malto-oligosyltrehalose synthase [Paracidovorax valerianellae]MDA8445333.1 malto-oligosyltrehalose synthase [Paracidovorax valerianellae]SDC19080.1 maltooligosyl trehalose synthase [Paracidovorax valerianellae]